MTWQNFSRQTPLLTRDVENFNFVETLITRNGDSKLDNTLEEEGGIICAPCLKASRYLLTKLSFGSKCALNCFLTRDDTRVFNIHLDAFNFYSFYSRQETLQERIVSFARCHTRGHYDSSCFFFFF